MGTVWLMLQRSHHDATMLPALFIALGLIALAAMIFSFLRLRTLCCACTQRAEGVVEAIEEIRGKIRLHRHTIACDIDGERMTLKRDVPADSDACAVGDSIPVWYDPAKPGRRYAGEAKRWESERKKAVTGIVLAAAFVIIGIFTGAAQIQSTGRGPLVRHILAHPLSYSYRIAQTKDPSELYIACENDDFRYSLREGGFIRLDKYVGKGTALVIPDALDGFLVREIGGGFLYLGQGSFETLTLPGSLEGVPAYQFSHCRRLARLTLQEGIVRIREGAFLHCDSLQEVFLPASLNEIAPDAFPEDCKALFCAPSGSEAERICRERGWNVAEAFSYPD